MKKDLFTINQIGKVCGISRSTILRLEKRGFLTPVYCNEDSGYRYYDCLCVTKIMQIRAFLDMGLQYDDIAEYYNSGGGTPELLEKLKQRIFILKRAYEEMNLRIEDKNHLTAEIINLPEYVCYAKEFSGLNTENRYNDMYNMYNELIKKGYKPHSSKPVFVINKRDDFLNGKYEDIEVNYICCVPVDPDCASEETVTFPACRVLSALYYGSYDNFRETYLYLSKKVKELGLKPIDYPRTMGLVMPATGQEINPDKYVTRLVLPVE
ncbi:MAG: MerR family transcriptional regulator [Oscillospiraceae bacterium]|nr:MerR family transcriptional regulator [Oscillospiraceae bacterium]